MKANQKFLSPQPPLLPSNQNFEPYPDSSEESRDNGNNLDSIKDLKSKLKIMTTKFQQCKKEKEILVKENRCLQEEIMNLQSNLRQMIPGFANTSSNFPMFNELCNQTSEFYKYDCIDIFFDLLCPELNLKGIIFFFSTCYSRLSQQLEKYFLPLESTIQKTGCISSIEGPIINVLRKSFQTSYKDILKKFQVSANISDILSEIQNNLKLGNCSIETNKTISNYLTKLSEFILMYFISDPPIYANFKNIGSKVQFNPTKHEPLDGFIKQKEDCIIVLPGIHRNGEEGEIIGKGLVLGEKYEIPN
jgi:regulator of replication initiation timing